MDVETEASSLAIGDGLMSSVQQVFAVEELLLPILEFATSGSNLKDSLALRLVCKNWRKSGFKMLSAQHPSKEVIIDDLAKLSSVKKLSSECLLPMAIKILLQKTKELSIQHLNFIHKYAYNIVRIEFHKIVEFQIDSKLIKNLSLELPNLRNLEVKMDYDFVYYRESSGLHSFIKTIVENAPRLKIFKIIVDVFKVNETSKLPEAVTHLAVYFCSYSDLHKIFGGTSLPKLQTLELYSLEKIEEETEVLSEVVNNLSESLETLKISFPQGTVELKLNLMKKLRELCLFTKATAIQTPTELSLVLPSLKILKLRGVLNVAGDMGKFDKLEILEISHRDEENHETQQGLLKLLMHLIPASSNLKSLSWTKVPLEVGKFVMPHVFAGLTKLKRLEISLKHFRVAGPQQLELVDWCYLLTGLQNSQIPNDESLRADHLNGKIDSITNLKDLEELRLASFLKPYNISAYLFNSAFLQMPTLQKLVFNGSIEVTNDLRRVWRDLNRQITVDDQY